LDGGNTVDDRYIISYDLGTSGVKVVLVTMKGKVIGSAIQDYPLYITQENWVEQDPESYWDACGKATKKVLYANSIKGEDCIGIVFSTQWKGIIPIDGDGKVLHNSIIWMDKRAGVQAKQLNQAFGKELFCESDYWPKLAWLRENRFEIYEKSEYILEANSYLKWKATGAVYSDITNCYTRSYSPAKQSFYDKTLKYANIEPNKFPHLCNTTDIVGKVSKKAAEELGVKEGIPVFGGCCDIAALAIGTGSCSLGDAHAYLGTSGWIGYVLPHDPDAVYVPPLDKEKDIGFYGLGISVGPSTNWIVDQLYLNEKEELGSKVWTLIDKELENIGPGSGRLIAAPWFFGGRPPFSSGEARAIFANLNSSHTRAHMMSAVMEGICYTMRQNLEELNKKTPIPLERLTVCGGGTNNAHWMQAMANILKIDIIIPENSENAGAIGAAYCALIGLGICKSFDTIKDHIKIAKVYHPDRSTFAEYDLIYEQYKQLHESMSWLFDALNRPID
jgi:xylulokinase